MAREVDWLLLQTSGKKYFNVVLTHTTHPKGDHSIPFPTAAAAELFARNNVRMPGISRAVCLDTDGNAVLVFDGAVESKYTVETIKTETGYAYQYKE